jgi:hypothetical protein
MLNNRLKERWVDHEGVPEQKLHRTIPTSQQDLRHVGEGKD